MKCVYLLKNHKHESKPKIRTTLEFKNNKITLEYQVLGHMAHYHFPKPTKQKRANNLWLDSSFELFLAPKNRTSYYEINVSPSTQWNAYMFQAYKQEMKESTIFSTPSIKILHLEEEYSFSFEMAVQEGFLSQKLEINLAVILLGNDGVRNFYSLVKGEGMPDFHDREGFVVFT